MRKINKPWGYEEILEENSEYTVKRLLMKKGQRCSYQYHKMKKETIYCLTGALTIVREENEILLLPGESVTLPPLEKHRMWSKTIDSLYLESSTTYPDDVIRVEDDYGR